jgi:peptidoglycan/xylan/chitin deacetylase (PgdA/CDA1 family)
MNHSELAEMAESGIDIQLHTHRHRTPIDEGEFRREIRDNRESLGELGKAKHFCYPSGVYHAEFLPWLEAEGVESATTCDADLATADSNPLLLPRLVDTAARSAVEFESWLSGVGAAMAIRKRSVKLAPAAAGRQSQARD